MSIIVKNLKHIYAEGLPHSSIAIDDVSFSITDGEFVGIIGHTGSGKSTLLQHLNALIKPTSGQIFIDNMQITQSKTALLDIRKKIGLVFQYPEYQLFEESVAKDIAFGPNNLNLKDSEIEIRIREALELVGLNYDDFADKSPFDLSGGQKRKVAIAGVLAMKPDILMLDEPTAGLDPRAHKDILNMIGNIHRQTGNICIFVSHNMNDIAQMCDRILVMNRGRLEMEGTPEQIFGQPEQLRSIGLALPDVTQLLLDLRDRGFEVPEGMFNIEDAEKVIYEIILNAGCAEEESGGIDD